MSRSCQVLFMPEISITNVRNHSFEETTVKKKGAIRFQEICKMQKRLYAYCFHTMQVGQIIMYYTPKKLLPFTFLNLPGLQKLEGIFSQTNLAE